MPSERVSDEELKRWKENFGDTPSFATNFAYDLIDARAEIRRLNLALAENDTRHAQMSQQLVQERKLQKGARSVICDTVDREPPPGFVRAEKESIELAQLREQLAERDNRIAQLEYANDMNLKLWIQSKERCALLDDLLIKQDGIIANLDVELADAKAKIERVCALPQYETYDRYDSALVRVDSGELVKIEELEEALADPEAE